MDHHSSITYGVGDQKPVAEALPLLTFTCPDQVVNDASLSLVAKREILASWASDARAVPDDPRLRRLDSGADVPVQDILAALRGLADETLVRKPLRQLPLIACSRRKRGMGNRPRCGITPDDDDPGPVPSLAAFTALAA